jgi:hypothetical protein
MPYLPSTQARDGFYGTFFKTATIYDFYKKTMPGKVKFPGIVLST